MLTKIVVSLFSMHELSSGQSVSRMLLQQPELPPLIPETLPENPAVPQDPIPPIVPENPAVPQNPIPPDVPATTSTTTTTRYIDLELPATTPPSVSPTTTEPSASPTTAEPSAPPSAAPTARPPPPNGFSYGAFNQLCPISSAATTTSTTVAPGGAPSRTNQCLSPADIASDSGSGQLWCTQPGDCCLCSAVECGFDVNPCKALFVGEAGMFGVKNVRIAGDPSASQTGAIIDCTAIDSCRETIIYGNDIQEIECGAPGSCQDSVITINDPKPYLTIDCGASHSCRGTKLEINFSEPPQGMMCNPDPDWVKPTFFLGGIECSGAHSCEGLEVTINNLGCEKVIIDTLECIHPNACTDARFVLNGDIDVKDCMCGPSCSNAMGLDQCFKGLQHLICSDPLSCSGMAKVFTNPLPYFEQVCGNVESCKNANFVYELVADSTATIGKFWKGFKIGGENAARGATFTIDNQLPNVLQILALECGNRGSCADTTFITGPNVNFMQIKCAAGACYGCRIKENSADPGQPCDPNQLEEPSVVDPINVIPGGPGPIVELPQGPQGLPQIPIR